MATLVELAQLVGGGFSGDPNLEITGVGTLDQAAPGQLSFFTHPKYKDLLKSTRASAILGSPDLTTALPCIRVKAPYLAIAKIVEFFHPAAHKPIGVHALAVIGSNPQLAPPVSIYPLVYIGDNVSIGRDCIIHPNATIGDGVRIGCGTVIHSGVSIYPNTVIGERVIIHSGAVIGSDGFGYAEHKGRFHKIPQVGNVVIEDDVEIGANTTIDRAFLGSTIIKRGTKIDNLVQIAHNVIIGEDCIIVGQAGIAGSTRLGHHVMVSGQVGMAGHLDIGPGVKVAARTLVTKDVPAGETVGGFIGMPAAKWRRTEAATRRLPELLPQFRSMEKRLAELEKKLAELENKE